MTLFNTNTQTQRFSKQNTFDQTPKPFDRETELPKLIGLWPSEVRDDSAESSAKIVALLSKALRAERRLGRAGHWSYSLTRHLALAEALKAERLRFENVNLRAQAKALLGSAQTQANSASANRHPALQAQPEARRLPRIAL